MRKTDWREDEILILALTPVPSGLFGPVLSLLAMAGLLLEGVRSVNYVHRHQVLIAVVVLGPTALLVLTRVWRWRSRRVTVTSHRVNSTHGPLRRHSESLYFDSLVGVHTQRKFWDRLTRRGEVWIDGHDGSVRLGRFRHPDSLVRVIQHQRDSFSRDSIPLNTTFDFEMPVPFTPRIVRRRSHRQE
jgi:hypothetical protein